MSGIIHGFILTSAFIFFMSNLYVNSERTGVDWLMYGDDPEPAQSNQLDLSSVGSSFKRNFDKSPPAAPATNQLDLSSVGSSFKRGSSSGSTFEVQQPSQPSWPPQQQNIYSPAAQPSYSSFSKNFNPSKPATFENISPPQQPSAPPHQSHNNNNGKFSSFRQQNDIRGASPPAPPTAKFTAGESSKPETPKREPWEEWLFSDYSAERWAEHNKHVQGYVDSNRQRLEESNKKLEEERRQKEEQRKQEAKQKAKQKAQDAKRREEETKHQAQETKRREEDAKRRGEEAQRRAEERGLGGQRRRVEPSAESAEKEFKDSIRREESQEESEDSEIHHDKHRSHSHNAHPHHKFSEAEAQAAEDDEDEVEDESSDPFYKRYYKKIRGSAVCNFSPSITFLVCISVIIVLLVDLA